MNSIMGDVMVGQMKSKLGLDDDSSSNAKANAESESDVVGGIDWSKRNYPHERVPFFHYDPANDKLPDGDAVLLASRLFLYFKVTAGMWCWMLISNIVCVASGFPGYAIALSIILGLLLVVGALWTFYTGYRAIAAGQPDYKTKFMIQHGIFCVLSFLFIIIPAVFVHGLATLAQSPATGVVVMTVIDSLLWTAVTVFGVYLLRRMHHYDVVLKRMSATGAAAESRRSAKEQRMAEKRAKLQAASASSSSADAAEPDVEAQAQSTAAPTKKKSLWPF